MQQRSMKRVGWLFTVVLAAVLSAATVGWAKSKTALSPEAKAGQKVFQENCALCHFPDQTNNKIGPGLKGVLTNKELPFSHRPATVANVEEQIKKGNPQGKPMPMPPFATKLSAKDMSNLIAYLKTL